MPSKTMFVVKLVTILTQTVIVPLVLLGALLVLIQTWTTPMLLTPDVDQLSKIAKCKPQSMNVLLVWLVILSILLINLVLHVVTIVLPVHLEHPPPLVQLVLILILCTLLVLIVLPWWPIVKLWLLMLPPVQLVLQDIILMLPQLLPVLLVQLIVQPVLTLLLVKHVLHHLPALF